MREGLASSRPGGFPPLKEIRVGLFYKHPRLSEAGLQLVNHLVAKLDEAAIVGRAQLPADDS
jgi:hypothetical protein